MNDVKKIVTSFEVPGLLLKDLTKTVVNQIKRQRCRFFSMLLGTLEVSLPRILLSGKGVVRARNGVIKSGDRMKKERVFNVASSFN